MAITIKWMNNSHDSVCFIRAKHDDWISSDYNTESNQIIQLYDEVSAQVLSSGSILQYL